MEIKTETRRALLRLRFCGMACGCYAVSIVRVRDEQHCAGKVDGGCDAAPSFTERGRCGDAAACLDAARRRCHSYPRILLSRRLS